MAKKQAHAEHNMELCEVIRKANKHFDWVITTAFYSALHFVDLKIFPFPVGGGGSCNDIKTAKSQLRMSSKHETRLEMVKLQCTRPVYDAYRWLYTASAEARYTTYKFQACQADKALDSLRVIQKYCVPAPTEPTETVETAS